jgi:hypothetical protein
MVPPHSEKDRLGVPAAKTGRLIKVNGAIKESKLTRSRQTAEMPSYRAWYRLTRLLSSTQDLERLMAKTGKSNQKTPSDTAAKS